MLLQLLFLLVFLALLFLLSQKITTLIYKIIYLLSKSRRVAIGLLSFFLLPGTIIHELSHFLVATLLRVPTGELTIFPSLEKEKPAVSRWPLGGGEIKPTFSRKSEFGEVKVGKLMIGKSDPVRHILIGLAPLLVGVTLIYLIGTFLIGDSSRITYNVLRIMDNPSSFLLFIVYCLLLFAISNTMFSSKKDLESLIIVAPVVLLTTASLYFIGVRIFFEEKLIAGIAPIVMRLNFYLMISLILNFLVYAVLGILFSLGQKVLKRTITY